MEKTIIKYENSPYQEKYATILSKFSNLGLFILVISYLGYISGFSEPFIPFSELSSYWSLPLGDFIEKSGAPVGWQWLDLLAFGDYQNFIGIALLSGVTIIAYGGLFLHFLKSKQRLFLSLVTLELFFLLLAASNLIQVGGH